MENGGHEANNADVNYQVYLDERRSLVDGEFEESKLFDRAILSLAAGAFGLTLTFIRHMVPSIKAGTLWMLVCAWIGFSASLLSTLISFLTSQSAYRRQRGILEADFFHQDADQKRADRAKNPSRIWTNWLNRISITGFIFGVVFMAAFTIANLSSTTEDKMGEERKGKAVPLTEGSAPAESPKKPGQVDKQKGALPAEAPRRPPSQPPQNKEGK